MGARQSSLPTIIGVNSAGQNYSCDLVNGQLACNPSPPAAPAENYLTCEPNADGSGLLCQGIQLSCLKSNNGGLSCQFDQLNAVGQVALKSYAEVAQPGSTLPAIASVSIPATNVTVPATVTPSGPAVVQPASTIMTGQMVPAKVVQSSSNYSLWILIIILIFIIILFIVATSYKARRAVIGTASDVEAATKRGAEKVASAFSQQ